MRRGQARFAIAVVAISLFVAVGCFRRVSVRVQKHNQAIIDKLAEDLAPGTDQRMKNFHRAKVRDEKKVWEIAARQARYSEETGEIIIDEPALSFYLKDGEMIALRCREGRIYETK